MKIVAILLLAVSIATAFASIEVADLDSKFRRVKGDLAVCDELLTIKLTGNTVEAKDFVFDDDETNCTGSLSFKNEMPGHPIFQELTKDFPVENVLFSNSTITCSKKGEDDFTFRAAALQATKNLKVLDFELPTERIALILFNLAEDYCAYRSSVTGLVCFPATGKVRLANGAVKTMDQLSLNDEVDVGRGRSSRIFMFTHALADANARFTKLTTASGDSVTLTPSHHLYANGVNKPARDVRVGDTLELADGSISDVIRVEAVRGVGLFNPQTMHGDIVVDGVRVSTYTETVYPRAAHALLAPFRLAYQYGRTTCSAFESGMPDFRGFLF